MWRQAPSKHTPVLYSHPEAREIDINSVGDVPVMESTIMMPRQHSNPLPISPVTGPKPQRLKMRPTNSYPAPLSSVPSSSIASTPLPPGHPGGAPLPTRSSEVFSRFQRKFRHDSEDTALSGMSFLRDGSDSEDGHPPISITSPPASAEPFPFTSQPARKSTEVHKASPKPARAPVKALLTEIDVANITPAERERLEWQAMLTSVLDGEVFRSEKTRIVVALDKVEAGKDNRQDIWLGIRAWLRGHSEKEEQERLNERRSRVVASVIEEVLDFKVIHEPDPDTHQSAPSPIEQVQGMLDRYDVACSLYPSLKEMQNDHQDIITSEANVRIDTLISWAKLYLTLHQQLDSLRRWTGSQSLDIQEPIKPTDIGVVGEQANAEELTTFLDRILKEDSLHRTFEKGTLITLHALIETARNVVVTQSPNFQALGLPLFEDELVQLISFPLKLVSASLQMRLQSAARVKDPNLMVLETMTDDFRLAIALACTLKREYEAQMEEDPEGYWKLPPCTPDNYDAVLLESVLLFFKLLHWRLKSGTKAIYFKETDVLEAQEDIMEEVSETIEGGASVVAEQLWCVRGMGITI
jgi:mitogen-activated protein kinase kinase kinase